jgi:hypothetical protein
LGGPAQNFVKKKPANRLVLGVVRGLGFSTTKFLSNPARLQPEILGLLERLDCIQPGRLNCGLASDKRSEPHRADDLFFLLVEQRDEIGLRLSVGKSNLLSLHQGCSAKQGALQHPLIQSLGIGSWTGRQPIPQKCTQ